MKIELKDAKNNNNKPINIEKIQDVPLKTLKVVAHVESEQNKDKQQDKENDGPKFNK